MGCFLMLCSWSFFLTLPTLPVTTRRWREGAGKMTGRGSSPCWFGSIDCYCCSCCFVMVSGIPWGSEERVGSRPTNHALVPLCYGLAPNILAVFFLYLLRPLPTPDLCGIPVLLVLQIKCRCRPSALYCSSYSAPGHRLCGSGLILCPCSTQHSFFHRVGTP